MVTELSKKQIGKMLSKIKSNDGKSNLFEHLQKMHAEKKTLNNDQLYHDLFEDISIRIKNNGYYIPSENKKNLYSFLESFANTINPIKNLLKPLMKIEPESEPVLITTVNFVPDYVEIFHKIQWAGISFGEKQSLLLTNSLRNLSSTLSGGNVSFFGMITGTEKDYYIAEATDIEPPAEYNYDPDMEKRKEDGVNRNTIYVTNNLCEKWVELPDIKPAQIKTARKIRYIFTGDLNRPLYTNPHFPGLEKHFLRCQLARIYHGTKLVPSINHYTIEDAENPFKPFTLNEKPKPFSYDELVDLKYWIHYPPGILKCGRVSHIIDDAPEGVDPDENRKKQIDKDPFDKRIKPATDDKPMKLPVSKMVIDIPAWKLNQLYEDTIYVNPYIKLLDETQPDFDPLEQKDNKANYLIICVKSLRWPGAYNILIGKESFFFYFGNGIKYLDPSIEDTFVYKTFPIIPSEPIDLPVQSEPREKDQMNPNGPIKDQEKNE